MVTHEQFYALSDPLLQGVEVGARVVASDRGREEVQAFLVFRHGNLEASVTCIHVALATLPPADMPREIEQLPALARSAVPETVTLAPEEHFFALRSYAEGIAEVGLANMFRAALDYPNLPVGFNVLMQAQVLRALHDVIVPREALQDLLEPAREAILAAPMEWRIERIKSGTLREILPLLDLDLTGADLSRADFVGADFNNGKLERASFAESFCQHADFGNANLAGANLQEAQLGEALLAGANLAGANLARADLTRANLSEANLSGATLEDATLDDADLSNANLANANLQNAFLGYATLWETNLRGANLAGADLGGADVMEANFEGANLEGADLHDVDLEEAHIQGAKFGNNSRKKPNGS